jgi:hypothetical protein
VSNDNVFKPAFDDQLTEMLSHGARSLLAPAAEAESRVSSPISGHRRCPGHLAEHEVMTGIRPPWGASRRVTAHSLYARDPATLHALLEVDRDAAAGLGPQNIFNVAACNCQFFAER